MSYKVIFLDIDGVLNNSRSCKLPLICSPEIYEYSPFHGVHQFDKSCVDCLNKIVAATNAKVVISSDWRLYFPEADGRGSKVLINYIKSQGVEADIIGYTPVLYLTNVPRGLEIQKWLEDHNIANGFVILDDLNNMAHLRPYLVQTGWKQGLTEKKHFNKAINILMKG